jgi:hypothetical protein
MSKRSQAICLNAPAAQNVLLAGSCNDWKAAPLLPGKKGEWMIAVPLPPGRHEAFGTTNRVLEVPSELERG